MIWIAENAVPVVPETVLDEHFLRVIRHIWTFIDHNIIRLIVVQNNCPVLTALAYRLFAALTNTIRSADYFALSEADEKSSLRSSSSVRPLKT